ncbi:enoyl-CoA hydratase/isomerase family protein [Alkalihalobacillus sp. BA299]|uniref:enoyl-CoA hydratase/isomerase family protein n=1 Tax=Alkalihalobacillus sp. BA299 TaxID=2815938 RepID=UPI001ADA9395|nr:enoyl-CoA hydratase-related protein [Alkalihalobacillus sp. BA299]
MEETKSLYVTYDIQDFIATITINNPPLNVLTDTLLNELEVAVDKILLEPSCRALVIRAMGEKAFVAGANINQFPSLDAVSGKQLVEKGKKIFDQLAHAHFPVICAINGLALGGGLELALACDIRIAEEKAKLGLPETGLGILPGYGGTQRLARLIGQGKAKELIFTGAAISSEEAYNVGLVEKVVPNGESYSVALSIAKEIASKGPKAISLAKAVIDQGLEASLAEGQELESNAFAELCCTEDMQEGVRAFKEKRKPNFQGK